MPGNAACGRCGMSLQLQATAIAVHPPRASVWQKRWRRWFPWQPRFYRVREVLAKPIPGMTRFWQVGMSLPTIRPGTLLRMIAPGWALAHEGYARRGRILAICWAVLLIASVVCAGSTVGALFFGAALAVHAGSAIQLLIGRDLLTPFQAIATTSAGLAIVAAIYLPFLFGLREYISTRQLLITHAPFSRGDVVVLGPSAYSSSSPKPGDVVVYRNHPFQVGGQRYLGWNAATRVEGEWVDRVIAGPGSNVHWDGKQLFVDGQPSQYQPLSTIRYPAKFDMAVTRQFYCILPTTNPFLGEASSADLWKAASLHYRGSIVGKAYVRNYPLWRWWWLN